MKKISALGLLLILSLTGCLGFSSKSSAGEKKIDGFQAFSADEFLIQIPEQWQVIPASDFRSDIPKNTIAAFRNNIRNARFTATIAIVKNELPQEVEALDYAKALRQRTQESLTNYTEILTENTQVSVGGQPKSSLFFIAQGREGPEKDLKRFVQTSAIKGKTAYIAIGAMLEKDNTDVAQKLETAIRNFEVK